MPLIAKAPSGPLFVFGRALGPPRRVKFTTAPAAPPRKFTDGSSWTSTSARGCSLRSFTTPEIVAPRFRTTLTPAFVPPAGSERPATVARSKSAWLTKSRWLSPGARRDAVNVPSGRVRNAVTSAPRRSMRRSPAKAFSPPRVSEPRAAGTGAPLSSTTFPVSVAPGVSATSSFLASPGASASAASTHGTWRASSTVRRYVSAGTPFSAYVPSGAVRTSRAKAFPLRRSLARGTGRPVLSSTTLPARDAGEASATVSARPSGSGSFTSGLADQPASPASTTSVPRPSGACAIRNAPSASVTTQRVVARTPSKRTRAPATGRFAASRTTPANALPAETVIGRASPPARTPDTSAGASPSLRTVTRLPAAPASSKRKTPSGPVTTLRASVTERRVAGTGAASRLEDDLRSRERRARRVDGGARELLGPREQVLAEVVALGRVVDVLEENRDDARPLGLDAEEPLLARLGRDGQREGPVGPRRRRRERLRRRAALRLAPRLVAGRLPCDGGDRHAGGGAVAPVRHEEATPDLAGVGGESEDERKDGRETGEPGRFHGGTSTSN